jgi:hypothetical protein
MATETIKIVYEVETSALEKATDALVKNGKAAADDVAKYEALAKAVTETEKVNEELAKSTEDLNKELAKTGSTTKELGDDYVSLAKQIKAAKEEQQRAVEKFGATSKQASAATQSLAVLQKRVEDLNKAVRLVKPEERAAAFTKFGSSAVGALQTVTGALQLFGVENQKVQQIATQLQGAINVSQGITDILKLKDSFGDLGKILPFVSAAQTAYNTAVAAGSGVVGGLSAAFKALAASIASTGIGAIVVALGALAGALLLSADNTDIAADSTDDYTKSLSDLKKAQNEAAIAELRLAQAQTKDQTRKDQLELAIKQLQNESAVLDIKQKQADINNKIAKQQAEINKPGVYAALGNGATAAFFSIKNAITGADENLQNLKRDAGLVAKELAAAEDKNASESEALNIELEQRRQQRAQAEEERKKQAAEAEKARLKALSEEQLALLRSQAQEELEILKERQKGEELDAPTELAKFEARFKALDELKNFELANAELLGLNREKIALEYDNKEKELLQRYYAYVKDLRDKDVADAEKAAKERLDAELKAAQAAIDARNRISAELTNAAQTQKIRNEVDIEDNKARAKANFEVDKTLLEAKIALAEEGSDEEARLLAELALLKKKYADDEKENRRNDYEAGKETLAASLDFIAQLESNRIQNQQNELEKQKEAGIITEEQYQEKLKKLKIKQARADKEAAIFSASISFAEALVNVLTIKPASAIPVATAFAAAIGGLNLAKIIATPLPKFNKGTLSVAGVDMGTDTVHAMLRPGEAVIPVDTNKAYHPAIKAIYQKKISPAEINSFVLNKLSGKGSMGKDTQITASVDSYALGRVMGKNRDVNVGNASVVGKIIANELSKKINPRQII